MIAITNCPVTGLKRKVVGKVFTWDDITRQIIIKCFIKHYNQQDEIVENARINSYTRNLLASDSLVKPQNGVLLSESELEAYREDPTSLGYTPLEEYDYWVGVVGSQPIVLPNVLEQIILLRDQEGKFNI